MGLVKNGTLKVDQAPKTIEYDTVGLNISEKRDEHSDQEIPSEVFDDKNPKMLEGVVKKGRDDTMSYETGETEYKVEGDTKQYTADLTGQLEAVTLERTQIASGHKVHSGL
jgi:hypothetical protein